MHAGGQEEEDLLVHLVGWPENLFDMGIAVGFGVAVGEVKGRDDFTLIAGLDVSRPKELHHLGEAVDVALHHDGRHGNPGVLRQAILLAQFFRHQGIMGLGPRGEEILRQRDTGGRMALREVRDTVSGGFEVRARDHCP